MNTLTIITVLGVAAVIILLVVLRKRHSSDAVEDMLTKRKPAAKVASRADYVQGMERLPVALALTETQFFYENEDFQGLLDLVRVEEVEYDDELANGKSVQNERVLRLRSHGQAFEFVLPRADADRWAAALPAHRGNEAGKVHAS